LNTVNNRRLSYSSILTTFNSENTIKSAVDSILGQRINPSEIIIVDDCSTDNTLEKLQELYGHVPNLKILNNPINSGQSYSRNRAAKECSADIIIIFDDDDISSPDRAKTHLELHQRGTNISFVSSTKNYTDAYEIECINTESVLVKLEPASLLRKLILGQPSPEMQNTWIPASTSAFDREYFLRIGGYDIDMRRLEDAEIVIRAAMAGCTASWSSEIQVTRTSTYSPVKGGVIEMEFEKRLLLKYQSLLHRAEFKRALTLIEIRSAYFSQNYKRLITLVCRHPSFLVGPHSRIVAFSKRIIHDRRQKG
jgi:glycosyltransferase involved in cell wall biosynthesis